MLSLWQDTGDIIEYGDKKFEYSGAFDVVCEMSEVLDDELISDVIKLEICLELLFGVDTELLNLNVEQQHEVLTLVFERLLGYKSAEVKYDVKGNPMPVAVKEAEEIAYSLKYDADYIYSAFRQTYGINLLEERGKLHWKEFSAMLNSLPDDTQFKKIVDIRLWKKPRKTDTQEKQYRRLKKQFALPKGGD